MVTMARQNATGTGCNRGLQSDICVTLNPDPRTITWERLETLRRKQLGLSTKHSRSLCPKAGQLPSSVLDDGETDLWVFL